MFRHYFARISTAIESFPDNLARELFAKKLLSQECLNEVLTTRGISSACKANILMCSIQSVIGSGSDESSLRDLFSVMRAHTQLKTLANKMMDRFGECAQFSLYCSARPNKIDCWFSITTHTLFEELFQLFIVQYMVTGH